MPIEISCPSCGNQGRFPDEWNGRQIECPRCRTSVPVGGQPNVTFGSPPAGPAERATPAFNLSGQFAGPSLPNSAGGIDTVISLTASPDAGPVGLPAEDPAQRRWHAGEADRFQAYVDEQLSTLRQQRHDLVNLQSHTEAQLVLRRQELGRLETEFAARADALRQREEGLTQREADFEKARADLREFQRLRADAIREVTKLREEIERTRTETEQARQAAGTARHELDTLLQRRQQIKAQQDAVAERAAQVERHAADLAQREDALKRRVTEVEELEDQIQRELEERRQELDAWQRLLEDRERTIGLAAPPGSSDTPRPS
jgi:hypothetical protein